MRRSTVAAFVGCIWGVGAAGDPRQLTAQAVTGRVVDSVTRKPLAGLIVRLVPGTDSARDTVYAVDRTEEDGAFVLSAPRPGTYRVRIGATHVGPPLTLVTADATDAHQYPVGPEPAAPGSGMWHVLRGAELDATLRDGLPLLDCEVDRPARAIRATFLKSRPPAGTPNGDGASLMLQFVVDTSGGVEPNTLRIWITPESDRYFVGFARTIASHARYVPAESGGRKVQQLVKLPLSFTPEGGSAPNPVGLNGCAPFVAPPPGTIDPDAPRR